MTCLSWKFKNIWKWYIIFLLCIYLQTMRKKSYWQGIVDKIQSMSNCSQGCVRDSHTSRQENIQCYSMIKNAQIILSLYIAHIVWHSYSFIHKSGLHFPAFLSRNILLFQQAALLRVPDTWLYHHRLNDHRLNHPLDTNTCILIIYITLRSNSMTVTSFMTKLKALTEFF